MLARRLTTMLPAMTLAEAVETTRIHRVAGLTGDRTATAIRGCVELIHAAQRAQGTPAAWWIVNAGRKTTAYRERSWPLMYRGRWNKPAGRRLFRSTGLV
jgi:Magnesium chelatase, subunit ChlI